MRAVTRSQPAPPALDKVDQNNLTERDRARLHQADASPNKGSFKFTAYKDAEVKRRLEEAFHGKCAYCETYYSASAPVDIEHFRPKGAVAEASAHPGYWWLAMSWENLLPSCIDCNRKRKQVVPAVGDSLADLQARANAGGVATVNAGKKDSFPIAPAGTRLQPEGLAFAAEQALLIDPCSDKPEDHLVFHVDSRPPIALVLPRGDPPSARGVASIHVYGLNRLGLVQDRTRLLRQLEFLGDLAIELGAMADQIGGRERAIARRLRFLQDRVLAEMAAMAEPEAPYSAMAAAWLRRFRDRAIAPRPRRRNP